MVILKLFKSISGPKSWETKPVETRFVEARSVETRSVERRLWNTKFWASALILILALLGANVQAVELKDHPKLQAVADQLIAEKYYSKKELKRIFQSAKIQQHVLDAMKSPAEYKYTWGKYRKIFLQADRIQQGVEFWRQYAPILAQAEATYGVPASVIVSIVGVESKYGKYRGRHKVLDSLVSLVVDFPRRSAFFADELKHFLILCKQNNLAYDEVMGSYAGAMGYPQFIASSYRNYAVDFSNDQVIDLINEPKDAIGSIANYLKENGWQRNQPITSVPVSRVSNALDQRANRKRKTPYDAAQLRKWGAKIDATVSDNTPLNVLMLNASDEVIEVGKSNIHIVRSGETACQIAESYSVPCRALIRLNKLDSKARIYRDQKLKLPTKAKASAQASVQSMPQYFFTHENFYVITRYNQSVLYAMAVYDLSEAIKTVRQNSGTR